MPSMGFDWKRNAGPHQHGPATDDPNDHAFDERFVCLPTSSEVAIANQIANGRYDETGGEVGIEEQEPA